MKELSKEMITTEYCRILGFKWCDIKEVKTKYVKDFYVASKYIKKHNKC